MRISCLMENTTETPGCIAKHGLSFYIETGRHVILMDTGPDDSLLHNAEVLGIDLQTVDTVILSHGHNDHCGGLQAFMSVNDHAKIYIQDTAFGRYCSFHEDDQTMHDISFPGIDPQNSRFHLIHGSETIDDGIFLFQGNRRSCPLPAANRNLYIRTETGLIPDSFDHEQYLAVKEDDTWYLFSGCAHHGILNVLSYFKNICHCDPAYVFSGFHMHMRTAYTRADIDEIRSAAQTLCTYPTVFYTCHCTGGEAYAIMSEIMHDQLRYIHCGGVYQSESQSVSL